MFGETVEVLPGRPQIRNGMMFANDSPGLGIDINEKLAAKYPHPNDPGNSAPSEDAKAAS